MCRGSNFEWCSVAEAGESDSEDDEHPPKVLNVASGSREISENIYIFTASP